MHFQKVHQLPALAMGKQWRLGDLDRGSLDQWPVLKGFVSVRFSVPGVIRVAGPGLPATCEVAGGTALVTHRPQPAKKQEKWRGDVCGFWNK